MGPYSCLLDNLQCGFNAVFISGTTRDHLLFHSVLNRLAVYLNSVLSGHFLKWNLIFLFFLRVNKIMFVK